MEKRAPLPFGWLATAGTTCAPVAVRLSLAVRERMSALASRWNDRGYDLGMGIGIAPGYATIGAIGFEGRWDYAAIGRIPNLAARLCGEAQSEQILINAPSLDGVGNLVEVEPVGDLTLKGFQRPVAVLNILGLKENQQGRRIPHAETSGPQNKHLPEA